REGEIQLVHLAADGRHQEGEADAGWKVRLAPDVHRELRGSLVELPDQGMELLRLEGLAAQRGEAGDEATAAGLSLQAQALGRRPVSVGRVSDGLRPQRPDQPGDVLPPKGPAEEVDQPVDEPRPDPRDERGQPALASRRRAHRAVVASRNTFPSFITKTTFSRAWTSFRGSALTATMSA